MDVKSIPIIGAGSWGTALAKILAEKGYRVPLWVFEKDLVAEIRDRHENTLYLPGVKLPETIQPSSDLEKVISGAEYIIWVTPTHTVRQLLMQAKEFFAAQSVLIGASKGIENGTLMRMSEVVDSILKDKKIRYVTLSGPTFANDVARNHPTTAVVACKDQEIARSVQHLLNARTFRVYLNTDQIGVELGGALKNVIAIATGITSGLGLGSNSRAALITRGLWEITRLGHALGANSMTFQGLSGMGDLVLTCDGTQSRNFKVGFRIGQGETLESIQSSMRMVAEGVKTTLSARDLARKHYVEMPITEQVYLVLYHGKSPRTAAEDLMSRSLKSEHQMDYGSPEFLLPER